MFSVCALYIDKWKFICLKFGINNEIANVKLDYRKAKTSKSIMLLLLLCHYKSTRFCFLSLPLGVKTENHVENKWVLFFKNPSSSLFPQFLCVLPPQKLISIPNGLCCKRGGFLLLLLYCSAPVCVCVCAFSVKSFDSLINLPACLLFTTIACAHTRRRAICKTFVYAVLCMKPSGTTQQVFFFFFLNIPNVLQVCVEKQQEKITHFTTSEESPDSLDFLSIP